MQGRLRSVLQQLEKAEQRYIESINTSRESRWRNRVRQLEHEIGILNWVLEKKQ